jgi:hypothetical protein
MTTLVCLVLLAACAEPQPAPVTVPAAMATTAEMAAPAATAAPPATAAIAPQISAEAAAYLEAALEVMQANGLNRLSVDWEKQRAQAAWMAGAAQTPADTYHVIRNVLFAAGGRHSFFLAPEEAAAWDQVTAADTPAPRAKLLLERLGYVAVEGVPLIDVDDANQYATGVQQLIRELDAQVPCGWIVDLRENTGGNMYPMLAGLGPILGEGVAGQFIDPEGETTEWSYRDGQALIGAEPLTQVSGGAYRLRAEHPPVAVLTGFRTASSGEAMVISFVGRPNTRSFGRSTAGLSTANDLFPLSDGAMIVLTTAVMADRTGRAYGGQLYPDEEVTGRDSFSEVEGERLPQPALDWLLAQPACAPQPQTATTRGS